MLSKDSMTIHVVCITAGEWPAQKGLLVSQVLETARALQAKGHTVSWFAAIPLLSRLKRWVLRDHDLQWLQAECKSAGILFHYKIVPVTLGSPWSMLLRGWWHDRLMRHALDLPVSGPGTTRATVLHARSYDAADIGLRLRRRMHGKNPARPVVMSFDMRSFLGPESPMGHGAVGTAAYGFVKALEFELVRDSDVSFLPVNVGRRQYFEETGLTIQYAPIHGLDREQGWKVDFDTRWANRRIGYSGSVGQWHDPVLLRQIFDLFPRCRPQLASRMINAFADLDCKLYRHSELPDYYDGLLAVVIPGIAQAGDYYRTLQMRCNLFSTKASEALSMGVPLIVSSELQELADFVREHECGIVVDIRNGRPVLPQLPGLDSRALWERLTGNAARVGARFARSAVLEVYERAWEAALARRQGEQL
ncbi:hypothetical protein NVV93_06525 [Pseudomonas sp. LS44]|uniref:glycosyltransferase n=1 Tax=Pseudomonas sp. LS44 TaxID=1357074 RepID=UPI00215A2B04|nr:hypothetical protein [Pseudomonas sp. LS44]UVE19037.1 hypothetical protein NVV93_06525 [Pseudomonas sp. LS44]